MDEADNSFQAPSIAELSFFIDSASPPGNSDGVAWPSGGIGIQRLSGRISAPSSFELSVLAAGANARDETWTAGSVKTRLLRASVAERLEADYCPDLRLVAVAAPVY